MEKFDVLCINCESLVCIEEISMHSLVCVTPIEIVKDQDLVVLSNFRLEKLSNALNQIFISSGADSEVIEKLLEKIRQIKEITSTSDENFDKITLELGQIENTDLSLSLLLCLQRLKSILCEKKLGLAETHMCQLEKTSSKRGVFALEKCEKVEIFEINSVIDPISRRSLSLTSIDSSQAIEVESDFLSKLLKTLPEEDYFQKYFYSKVLIMKLEYPSNHPVQDVNLDQLYEKSKKSGIVLDDWEGFIRTEFNLISR